MMHPSRQSDPHPRHLFQRLTGSAWDDCSNKIGEQDDGQRVSLAEELNLYRLLLAQLRSADPVSRSTLSRNLTFLIIREFGLRKLLTATFDFDESSQHVTTLDQRCQAMANLIAAPPVICCPLSQYFQQLSHQIHSLMKHDPTLSTAVTVFVNKLCALTVNSMVTRNRKLTLKTFIHPLISSLSNSGTPLTPQNCIEVVCGLALADFDLNLLLEAFPAILFAQFALEQTSSTQKQPLWLTITELLKRVDNSLYLLDDSLFNHYSTYANLFRVTTNASGTTCIVFRERCADEKINLMTHDHIVSSIMSLISDTFSEETQVDFCLLLLERLSFRHLMSPDCAFLLYALIVTLLERIEPLFCKFPRKWIRFISETLKRMSSDSVSKEVISDPANRGEESEVASAVRVDSIGVVMQILQILVNERSKVRSIIGVR